MLDMYEGILQEFVDSQHGIGVETWHLWLEIRSCRRREAQRKWAAEDRARSPERVRKLQREWIRAKRAIKMEIKDMYWRRTCKICGENFTWLVNRGRPPSYCSESCRKTAKKADSRVE